MPLRTLCVAFLLGLAPVALAADNAPRPLTSEELAISSAPTAGSPGQKTIADKVKWWFGRIQTGSPKEVKDARRELSSVLRKPEVTPVFQRLFLEIAAPEVEKLAASTDAFRATNALMVIRFVKTPEAFELVRQQSDPRKQKDVRIRAAAANLLPAMVDGGCVPPDQMDVVAGRIKDMVQAETDWVVAAQEMTALSRLASLAAESKMGPQSMAIRADLVEAVGSVVNRLATGKDRSAAPACYRGLIAVRDQMMVMSQSERSQLATSLTPVLKKVEEIPENTSDDASGDDLEWRGARKVAGTLKSLLPASTAR